MIFDPLFPATGSETPDEPGFRHHVLERAYSLDGLIPHPGLQRREEVRRKRRLALNDRLAAIDYRLESTPFVGGVENRLPLEPQGKLTSPARSSISDSEWRSLRKERELLVLRLEHELRRELECPDVTRDLSRAGFSVYLQMAQYERLAVRGRAFTFVLEGRNLTNRTMIIRRLRHAGLIVAGVIGFDVLDSGRRHPHYHGLVLVPEGVDLNSSEKIGRLLPGVAVLPMTPYRETATKAAGLGRGFLAFCLYLAENYDQEMPSDLRRLYRVRHLPDRRAGVPLSKRERKNLHPFRTRGELELYRRVFPFGRSSIRARQAFWRARPIPSARDPIVVILRDGYRYAIRPDWGYQITSAAGRSIPCEFERIDGPQPFAGECELDLILAACRFRRVIARSGEASPGCGPLAYTTVEGRVRPTAGAGVRGRSVIDGSP